MSTQTAYPLAWPLGYPRTRSAERRGWNAPVSIAEGRDTLLAELERTGAGRILLSTNLPLRRDGLPYASKGEPADTGVAVYFVLGGADTVLCCDAYAKVAENLRAIAVTVEQLRQISKRGVSDFVRRAFTGFAALPPAREPGRPAAQSAPPPPASWWHVLGLHPDATATQIERAYKQLAQQRHPDKPGGSTAQMQALNHARQQAHKSFISDL